MIFKVVCRADGDQLARYLLSSKNDRVAVLQLSGTVENEPSANGLKTALKDMDELAKMTRGTKTLVHLAINPNDHDRLEKQDWQYCVAKAELALGLMGQPRAIVSHTFHGKEHLHVVWSRVDIDEAKCIELPFSNLKMVQTAREVEIDLGLQRTPERNRGMAKAQELTEELKQGQSAEIERQLRSLPHSERGSHRLNQDVLQQERFQEERAQHSKAARDEILSAAWHGSSSGEEFKAKIEEAGYRLAIGRRGVLVVDENDEPHSIARSIDGVKQRDVKQKLAGLDNIPSIDDLRDEIQSQIKRDRARHLAATQVDEFLRLKSMALAEERFPSNLGPSIRP